MTETITLDPAAIDASRTTLDITSFISVDGPDWGDAAIQAYMSDQQFGSSPVDYRLPNRTIKIPLRLRDVGGTTFSSIRLSLQQKVALFQREGGSIMRQVNATPLYADIVNATLHLGGDYVQAFRNADVAAVLTLECLPDWYGAEVTLDTATATGVLTGKLKQSAADAVIAGNYPARCRIIVNDTSGNDQHGLLWGFRSRHYDSTTTGQLFYEAEALTAVNGAASAVVTGASGGSVVRLASPMPTGVWVSMLSTNLAAGSPLTHVGSYRVWARASTAAAATGTFQLQLLWGVGSLSVPVTNGPAQVPSDGGFYLVNLGNIRVDPLAVGTTQWFGALQAWSSTGTVINVDSLYLQPVDEGAAQLAYTPVAPASAIASPLRSPSAAANDAAAGTVTWSNPTNVFAHDGTNATVTLTGVQTSEWLKATGYGFAVPTGATIKGIAVQVYSATTTTGSASSGGTPQLVKAGVVQALTPSSGSGINPYAFGGSTDLWGGTWTPADVNNTGFGAAWSVNNFTGSTGTTTTAVDYIGITVWYTLASGFTVAQDAVIYANKTAELRTEGMLRTADGTVYGTIANAPGDLPRLPPSGMENRPVELLVKPSRGDLGPLADSGLDALSVQVKYRPSFLYIGA